MDKYKKKIINLEIIGVARNNKRTLIIKMENVALTKQNSDRLFEVLAKEYGIPETNLLPEKGNITTLCPAGIHSNQVNCECSG